VLRRGWPLLSSDPPVPATVPEPQAGPIAA
jgi:hypothetical protein